MKAKFKDIFSRKTISNSLLTLIWLYIIFNTATIPLPLLILLYLLIIFSFLEDAISSGKKTDWKNLKSTVNWKIFLISIISFLFLMFLIFFLLWNS